MEIPFFKHDHVDPLDYATQAAHSLDSAESRMENGLRLASVKSTFLNYSPIMIVAAAASNFVGVAGVTVFCAGMGLHNAEPYVDQVKHEREGIESRNEELMNSFDGEKDKDLFVGFIKQIKSASDEATHDLKDHRALHKEQVTEILTKWTDKITEVQTDTLEKLQSRRSQEGMTASFHAQESEGHHEAAALHA